MRSYSALLLLLIAACATTGQDPVKLLAPGQWVEAKGKFELGQAVVTELGSIERNADDKPDKVELTGEVTFASASEIQVAGVSFLIEAVTEYENAEKQKILPFIAKVSDWVRVKARQKGDRHFARSIRQSEAKGSFRLVGELRALNLAENELDIGGVCMAKRADEAMVMGNKRSDDDPLSQFLADDVKGVPFTIKVSESLRLGGQGTVSPEWNDDFGLDNNAQKDRMKSTYGGKLDALWLIDNAGTYGMFEVAFGRAETTRESSKTDAFTYTEQLEISRALISARLQDNLQLIVGRQDFSEKRRWLYDELLDGLRLIDSLGAVELELGGAKGRGVAAENNGTEDTTLLEANARWAVGKNWTLGAYVLKRFDTTIEDHEPLLYGLRSLDQPRLGVGHWLELGGASGHSTFLTDPNNSNSTRFEADLLGFAFDIGASYSFDAPLRPFLAAGYAIGTGAGINAKKQGYRQSGYNDNNGKMGSVTSIRYYGELLRPELSNIGIATLAGTIRPIADSSITLLFHNFIQDTPTTYSPINALSATTNGVLPDLGYEIDLVFGYRPRPGMTIELSASRFVPGNAFENQDPANKLEFTLRVGF
ncbi:MAG: hypothetical protein EXS02_09760 [Planctomycetes bacterium]|nr:hypothetical protein [Planctomycetota bacterium]